MSVPPRTSVSADLLDAAGHGALAGLVVGLADLLSAREALGSPVVAIDDVLAVTLAVQGTTALVGALAATLVAAAARPRGLPGLAASWLLVAAPLAALNVPLAQRTGAAGWGALAIGALGLLAAAWLVRRARASGRGWLLVSPAVLVAMGALAASARWFPGLYRPQHATLALGALAALTLAANALASRRPRFGRLGRLVLPLVLPVSAAALVGWPVAPGANGRLILERDTLATTHALDLVAVVGDWDGDGTTSLLGGADCGPHDATVHPGAREVLDDGIDQDCLGGDATRARLEALAIARSRLSGPRAPAATARPLVVLSVDALRADRAQSLAGVRALAARGVSFSNASVAYPSTILSFYSLFTGRAPSAVATRREQKWDVPVPDRSQTLADALSAAGYATTGLFFHHVFAPRYGITRGFQRVWTESPDPAVVVWGVSSPQTAERALQALDELSGGGAPFFLWVHFYDPHEPYVVHPEQPVADPSSYAELYDGEVRYTDTYLSRVVDRLLADGWPERALIVLLADHGESLGEGGRLFHNGSLTEEQVRVPLIVAGPGLPGGATRATPVSLQDLSDTLLAELGLPRLADSQGASFRRLLREADPPIEQAPPVFFEVFADAGVQRGVRSGAWKLTHHRDSGALSLVDVDRDPAELLNVVDLAPRVADNLTELISTWGAATAGVVGPASAGGPHGDQGEDDHPP